MSDVSQLFKALPDKEQDEIILYAGEHATEIDHERLLEIYRGGDPMLIEFYDWLMQIWLRED